MILSRPLVAIKDTKQAVIRIEADCFKLELDFKVEDHQSTHTFTDESTMFKYLEKFDIHSVDFKLSF